MDAKLVVVSGNAKASEVTLRLPAVIGRGREASVMLPHPLVSRRHCELFESNGLLVVRDMGSLNGTFVNNKRITEAVLPPGGLLTLGSVTFRAVYAHAAGGPAPAGVPVAVPGKSPGPQPAADHPREAADDFGDFNLVPLDDDSQAGAAEKARDKKAHDQAAQRETPPRSRSGSSPDDPPEDSLADFMSDL